MKIIANTDTKRTIIVWFLFSSRYFGTFLKSDDVYSTIMLAIAYACAKIVKAPHKKKFFLHRCAFGNNCSFVE